MLGLSTTVTAGWNTCDVLMYCFCLILHIYIELKNLVCVKYNLYLYLKVSLISSIDLDKSQEPCPFYECISIPRILLKLTQKEVSFKFLASSTFPPCGHILIFIEIGWKLAVSCLLTTHCSFYIFHYLQIQDQIMIFQNLECEVVQSTRHRLVTSFKFPNSRWRPY